MNIEKIKEFLKSKEGNNPVIKDLIDNIIFASYGGSNLYGTNETNSDNDMRAVVLLGEDYLIGLKKFTHEKLNSGVNGITTQGDMDLEAFHFDTFFQKVIDGETIPVEMLYAPDDKIIYMNELYKPLYENRDLFLSQNLLRHYKGLIFRHYNQAKSSVANLKKAEKIERVETYGYETKDVMKAIMYLLISIEFLETNQLNFFRKDREQLLEYKKGKLQTFEEADIYIKELMKKRDSLIQTSRVPLVPDYDKLNSFIKEYRKMTFRHFGIF